MTCFGKHSKRNLLKEILSTVKSIEKGQEKVMALIDDLQAAVKAQGDALDAIGPVITAIQADEAALEKQIADLIAAGGATTAQLQALLDTTNANSAKVGTIKSSLDALDASVPGGPNQP